MSEDACSQTSHSLSENLGILLEFANSYGLGSNLSETSTSSILNDTTLNSLNDRFLQSLTERLRGLQRPTSSFLVCQINHFLWTYIPPIIFIFGSLGNILAFFVLRHPSSGGVSAFVYLTARSVVDEIVLIVGLFRRWTDYLIGFKLENTSSAMCKLVHFWGTSSSLLSVWLTVTLTAERALVVSFPLHVSRVITYTRVRNIIFVISLTCVLLSLHFFFTVGLVTGCEDTPSHELPFQYIINQSQLDSGPVSTNQAKCTASCNFLPQYTSMSWYWTTFDAIIYSYFPFCLIMGLNIIILHFVYAAKKEQHTLRSFSQTANLERSSAVLTHRQSRSMTDNGFNVRQLTIMLLVVSFAFLLTTVSIVLVKILAQILDLNGPKKLNARANFQLADTIAELFMYVNHAMNFYLFCSTGKRFRTRLFLLLARCKRQGCIVCCERQYQHSNNINIRFSNTSRIPGMECAPNNRVFLVTTSRQSCPNYETAKLVDQNDQFLRPLSARELISPNNGLETYVNNSCAGYTAPSSGLQTCQCSTIPVPGPRKHLAPFVKRFGARLGLKNSRSFNPILGLETKFGTPNCASQHVAKVNYQCDQQKSRSNGSEREELNLVT